MTNLPASSLMRRHSSRIHRLLLRASTNKVSSDGGLHWVLSCHWGLNQPVGRSRCSICPCLERHSQFSVADPPLSGLMEQWMSISYSYFKPVQFRIQNEMVSE